MQKVHFRLTSVAQQRCCLSSLIFEADNLARDLGLEQDFSWQSFVYLTLQGLFLAASLVNISLISLERLNATGFSPLGIFLLEKGFT